MYDNSDLEHQLGLKANLYRKRAKRLYRTGMMLRAAIVLCAFLAVLPDSAIFNAPSISASYGIMTSVAGVIGALLFVLATNLRLVETMTALYDLIGYLEEQEIKLLARDGLSRRVAEIEIRKEISAREAALQKGVFAGLEKYFGSWSRQGVE